MCRAVESIYSSLDFVRSVDFPPPIMLVVLASLGPKGPELLRQMIPGPIPRLPAIRHTYLLCKSGDFAILVEDDTLPVLNRVVIE